MSNAETEPGEARRAAPVNDVQGNGSARVEVLSARDVPLGGPRAMTVRRTLPQRSRTLIGAWCFADHYGPDDVTETGGMDVAPHPHTGLQTVSWLFSGEIEHRDSLGSHAFVRPGELNLMTGGHGISHTEVSTPGTTILHGAQLWVALPEEHRHAERDFQHYVPEPAPWTGARPGSSWERSPGTRPRYGPSAPCSAPNSSSTRTRASPSPWTPPSSTAFSSTGEPSAWATPPYSGRSWDMSAPDPAP